MSNEPQGPGWWLASDGTWHPPELHPSMRENTSTMVAPAAVPEASVPGPAPAALGPESTVTLPSAEAARRNPAPINDGTKRPTWSGESDRRAEAGPMYPDLFKQAVSGSPLARAITVNFADGGHGDTRDVPTSSGLSADSAGLISSAARVPAEVGAFTGASAKKRWRRR